MTSIGRRLMNRLRGDQAARTDFVAQGISRTLAVINRRRNWIRRVVQGDVALVGASSVAVLVGWDKYSIIHDFVVSYAKGLQEAGFAVIYVTSSEYMPETQTAKLKPYVTCMVHRHNKGYDFGSYRDAVGLIPDFDVLDRLVVCNDSVYGPLFPLAASVFDRAPASEADVWGLTDSWDTNYHVQSYFVLFHRAAIQSKVFRKFWNEFLYVGSKSYVINNYEIGFTRRLMRAGLRVRGIFAYRSLVQDFMIQMRQIRESDGVVRSPEHAEFLATMQRLIQSGSPLNPTHFFWDSLIARHGFPFIKREIISSNPMRLPDMFRWEEMIAQLSDYDTVQIEDHLKLTLGKRAP